MVWVRGIFCLTFFFFYAPIVFVEKVHPLPKYRKIVHYVFTKKINNFPIHKNLILPFSRMFRNLNFFFSFSENLIFTKFSFFKNDANLKRKKNLLENAISWIIQLTVSSTSSNSSDNSAEFLLVARNGRWLDGHFKFENWLQSLLVPTGSNRLFQIFLASLKKR